MESTLSQNNSLNREKLLIGIFGFAGAIMIIGEYDKIPRRSNSLSLIKMIVPILDYMKTV